MITPNDEGGEYRQFGKTLIGGKVEARPTHGTEHGLEVAVGERDPGGGAHARAVRRLDAPERYWMTIQYRQAEAEPARGRAARVLNPRAVLLLRN